MSGILNEICSQYTLPQEVKAMGVYPYYRPIASGQDPMVSMADGSKVLMSGVESSLFECLLCMKRDFPQIFSALRLFEHYIQSF